MTRTLLAGAILAVLMAPAVGANRCVDAKGRVTYQDAACDGAVTSGRPVDTGDAFSTRPGRAPGPTPTAAPAGQGSSTDPAYATFRGGWRGPAQLTLTVAGAEVDPPGVAATVLEVKADGEVAGFIGQGGCAVSGLASQHIVPYIGAVSLTLSGCPDARFNGRDQGNLSANSMTREGRLSLSTFKMLPGNRAQIMSIAAVLKR